MPMPQQPIVILGGFLISPAGGLYQVGAAGLDQLLDQGPIGFVVQLLQGVTANELSGRPAP